jgi:hypothetical protein
MPGTEEVFPVGLGDQRVQKLVAKRPRIATQPFGEFTDHGDLASRY